MLQNKLNTPFITFIVLVMFVLIIGTMLLAILGADPLGIYIFILGAIIGPISVLTEPVNSLTFKLIYVAVLAILIGSIVFGLKKRNFLWGKGITFVAIVGWFYCGMLGMSA